MEPTGGSKWQQQQQQICVCLCCPLQHIYVVWCVCVSMAARGSWLQLSDWPLTWSTSSAPSTELEPWEISSACLQCPSPQQHFAFLQLDGNQCGGVEAMGEGPSVPEGAPAPLHSPEPPLPL